ncbi:MAG TPA: hypothetical protein DHU96_28955 [Actinobacteria bacterium]|nr:hypothetical protein [Actinomycetota bacterium]
MTGQAGQAPGVVKVRISGAAEGIEVISETAQVPGEVEVSLYGTAGDVATVAGLLVDPGVEVIERREPHPAAYGPGEHVWLLVRPKTAGGQR